jgi:hypothetical protein
MKTLLLIGPLLAAAAASAQTPPAHARQGPAYNPNETVCRMVRETGSRLSQNRICMTRAEWDQYRRQMRQNIDQAQTMRPSSGQ